MAQPNFLVSCMHSKICLIFAIVRILVAAILFPVGFLQKPTPDLDSAWKTDLHMSHPLTISDIKHKMPKNWMIYHILTHPDNWANKQSSFCQLLSYHISFISSLKLSLHLSQMHAVLLPLAVNQSYDFEDDRHTHSSLPGGGDTTQPRPSPRPQHSSHTHGATSHINKPSSLVTGQQSGSADLEDGINTRTRVISREPAMISRENTGDNIKLQEFEATKTGTCNFRELSNHNINVGFVDIVQNDDLPSNLKIHFTSIKAYGYHPFQVPGCRK